MARASAPPAKKIVRTPAAKPPALPPVVAAPASIGGSAIDTRPETLARLIRVEQGLHVLSIGATAGAGSVMGGIALPAIQVTSPPSDRFDPVEIMTEWADNGAWVGQDGGTLVLRAPPEGGHVLITAYAEPGGAPTFPEAIEVRPIEQPKLLRPLAGAPRLRAVPSPSAPAPADRGSAMPPADPREADIEITLHIARQGDRVFAARGWVGNLGQRLRIEGFSLLPRSKLAASDLEYKAFGPQGRETRWTSDGRLCGTRGRMLPLTGFAIQPLAHLRNRFDVIYQGAFFESGMTGLCRNGEPCLPARPDDVLEAINLRVVERDGA